MKKTALIVIIVFFAMLLTACGDDDSHERGNDREADTGNIAVLGNVENTIIENYIYLPQKIDLQGLPYQIQGAMLHGERIYYWYADYTANIIVASMDFDEGNPQNIQIPVSEGFVSIGGVRIKENGNIELIYSVNYGDGNASLNYGQFTSQGVEVMKEDLGGVVPSEFEWFNLRQAVFTENGHIALSGGVGRAGYELLLLDSERNLMGYLHINHGERISLLRDGRVVIWSEERTNNTLREICFDTGDFGEEFKLTVEHFRNLLCAGDNSAYDLLLFDGTNIIGYELETATATPLFNWFEINLGVAISEFFIGFLPSGQMFVLYSTIVTVDWDSEFFVLTRTSRADITDEPTVIVVGGIWVPHEIRSLATAFNRENQDYQIEIRCYTTLYEWYPGLTRFNLDMIAGQGPDVIVGQSADALEDTEFLACLYSFIDIDTELSREDFLPNILEALESRDGRLQFVTNNFQITLFTALPETIAQVGEMTLSNMLDWLSASDSRHLGPEWFNRYWLVHESLLSFSDEFIDFENGIAHLDSDEFINLLNIAYTLPEPEQFGFRSEIEDLLSGNQLINMEGLHNVDSLRSGRRTFLAEQGIENLIPVGAPSNALGQHDFIPHILSASGGIKAGSPHPEAAWSFLRLVLLAENFDAGSSGLPLRVDVLESLIAESMTPNIVNGEEIPRRPFPFSLELVYAMTEEEATAIRDVINNATVRRRGNEALENIINEGLHSFFAGTATAEDTARVLQSRVQTWLWERS